MKKEDERKYNMDLTESEALEVLFDRRPESLKALILSAFYLLGMIGLFMWADAHIAGVFVWAGLAVMVGGPVFYVVFIRGRKIRKKDTKILNDEYLIYTQLKR